jgi:hypothetical protein
MQVFIIGTPLETARALDRKRLNKQIIECRQILDALYGYSKPWSNHPCVLQYREHKQWLYEYTQCLEQYAMGMVNTPRAYSEIADRYRPSFHTQDYFDQMKRRLYQKNEKHYQQWSYLGKSLDNWYYIDGKFVKYRNGKKIKE